MKNLVAMLTAVAFAVGTTGAAVAQSSTTPPPAPEKKMEKTEKSGETKKADKKMASKTANGTIKSAAADSIVVAGKDKGKDAEWTFAVDAKTNVKKAGKSTTPADLKAGDSVQVRYMEHEGKAVAQTVTVRGGGADKKGADTSKKDDAMKEKPAEKEKK